MSSDSATSHFHIVPESAHRRLEPGIREVSARLFVHPPAFRIALPLVERTFAVEIHIGEDARRADIIDHKSLSPDLSVRILRLDLKNARLSGVGRLSLRFSRVPVQCILKCSTFFYSSKRRIKIPDRISHSVIGLHGVCRAGRRLRQSHHSPSLHDRRILRLFLSRCICHSHIRRPHIGAVRTLNSPGKSSKRRDLECCREDAGEDSCLDRFFHSDPPHLNLALIPL